MRRTCVVVFAVTAFALIAPSVQASLAVLDQHQENQGLYIPDDEEPQYVGFSYGVGGSILMAQTFTAGLTGYLDHVEIGNTSGATYYPASTTPVIEIFDTTVEGQPGSSLGSVTLDYPLPYNDWTLPINFLDQNILLNAGTMYSIVLSTSSEFVEVGAIGTDDPYPTLGQDPDGLLYPDRELPWLYPGGELWAEFEGSWWSLSNEVFDQPVYDIQFRTYVIPVPLPAGVWLGICAVGVAGLHLKRQCV